MAENKLADLSMDFAVKILKMTDGIKGHYSLTNQLERSATSIGANIREAKYAHSKADFISKLQIALKECYETEYGYTVIDGEMMGLIGAGNNPMVGMTVAVAVAIEESNR